MYNDGWAIGCMMEGAARRAREESKIELERIKKENEELKKENRELRERLRLAEEMRYDGRK